MDITSPTVPTTLLPHATDGYATLTVVRSAIQRKELHTPEALLPEPRAGHPRMVPLLAAYEFESRAWGRRHGIPSSVIGRAWGYRKRQSLSASGWTDDDFIEAARSGKLREFDADRDESRPAYWAMLLLDHNNPEYPHPDLLALLAGDDVKAMLETLTVNGGGVLMLNMTSLVRRVNQRLADAGWSQPT